jgi:hypothetical protein
MKGTKSAKNTKNSNCIAPPTRAMPLGKARTSANLDVIPAQAGFSTAALVIDVASVSTATDQDGFPLARE